MTTTARTGRRGHQPVARQHPPQLARVRRVPARWLDDGIVGVTSNPTIFQKAIADSSDYDEAVSALAGSGASAERGVLRAGDRGRARARPTRSAACTTSTDHLDGFVSFELPPGMANDTAASHQGGARVLGADRPAQHLHQDPGHGRGHAGDRGVDRSRHQHERHAAVLAAALRGRSTGRTSAGWSGGWSAASRSTTSTRWPASSSPGWTPRSTSCCRTGSPLRGKAAIANAKLAYQRYLEIKADDPLAGAGGEGRPRAAAAVGLHRHQESGILGRALRRQPDRAGVRQHDARPDDQSLQRPRHREPHGGRGPRRGARRARRSWRRPASRWTTSPTSSSWTGSSRSRSRSTRCSARSRRSSTRSARGARPERVAGCARQSAARRPAGGRRHRAGAVHDLRRHRRPRPAQAASRHLQPGQARPAARPASAWSAMPAPTWATRASAASPGPPSRPTRAPRWTSGSGRGSNRCCTTTPADSTTSSTSTSWPRRLSGLDR